MDLWSWNIQNVINWVLFLTLRISFYFFLITNSAPTESNLNKHSNSKAYSREISKRQRKEKWGNYYENIHFYAIYSTANVGARWECCHTIYNFFSLRIKILLFFNQKPDLQGKKLSAHRAVFFLSSTWGILVLLPLRYIRDADCEKRMAKHTKSKIVL